MTIQNKLKKTIVAIDRLVNDPNAVDVIAKRTKLLKRYHYLKGLIYPVKRSPQLPIVESFENPAFRLIVVKKAFVALKIRQNRQFAASLCGALLDIIEKEYPNLIEPDKYIIESFPELLKHKPSERYVFWFPTNDYKTRFKILRSAIKELKDIVSENQKG